MTLYGILRFTSKTRVTYEKHKGIEFIENSYNGILYLYTDSQYVINIFTNLGLWWLLSAYIILAKASLN
jgi:hypothetical protein